MLHCDGDFDLLATALAFESRCGRSGSVLPEASLTARPSAHRSTTRGMRRGILAIPLVGLVGACGGAGEDRRAPSAGGHLAADLRVTVRPEGPGGGEEIRRIRCARLGNDATEVRCRRLGRLTSQDLAPVPARTACAQVYAGPATAHVTGDLGGVTVSASFNLTDACELGRWKRNAALLGPPPR